MTTIKRAAMIFGIINLVIGISSLAAPLVKDSPDKVIARRPGLYLGLFATNWPHSVIHAIVGIIGLAIGLVQGVQSNLARIYFGVNAALFGGVAAMGWTQYGFKPGIHDMMGVSMNRYDNILHTIWGLGAAVLAALPMTTREKIGEFTETVSYERMNI